MLVCARVRARVDEKERTLQQRRKKQLCHLVVRVYGLSPGKNLGNSGVCSGQSVSIILPHSQSAGLGVVVTRLKLGAVCPALVPLA